MTLLGGRLQRDGSGNAAMPFSQLLIPLVPAAGLAVDFGRSYSVTSHPGGLRRGRFGRRTCR